MHSCDVPFELIDADEFEALEVAIAAAEECSSISSCKKSKFSTSCSPTGSTSAATHPISAPIKLTSNGAAKDGQSCCDSLNAARETAPLSTLECSAETVAVFEKEHPRHKHLADDSSHEFASRSKHERDASRLLDSAAGGGKSAYERYCRENPHVDLWDTRSVSDDLTLHPCSSNEVPTIPCSSSLRQSSEEEEITTPSCDETHRNPCFTRRLPSWQSYAGNHLQLKTWRPSGHMKVNWILSSGIEEVQSASYSESPEVVSEGDNKRPWGLAPFTCRVVPKCKLPYLQFKGQIKYSVTVSDAENAAYELQRQVEAKKCVAGEMVPLGFDTEWKVVFNRGAQPRKVAVLQLCIDSDNCNVFHVIHTGIPSPLRTILEDPLVSKVGVGAYGDARKLHRDYSVKVKGVKDLSGLANMKLAGRSYATKSWSLSSLSEELLGKQVDKNGSIRMGDWEVEELSEAQLQYAATDAFASLYLFQVLLTFPDPQKEVSPDNGQTIV